MAALTVLLPVHNEEQCLDAAISSMRGQSFADFELLVIDDHSSDGSAAIARRHAGQDPRVRLVENSGRGLVAALNFGIAQSGTPLVGRMDADDIALPERLERQMAKMAEEPDLIVLGTAAFRIDDQGRRIGTMTPPTEESQLEANLARGNPMLHPTVIMRREAVEAAGGYRPAYLRAEDYDLWLRLRERGRLGNLAEPLLEYRLRQNRFRADVFRQQVMSEMTARAAAALRRRGQSDPTGDWSAIDEAGMLSIGVEAGAIASEIARRALHMARQCRKLGDSEGCREALRLADNQPRAGAGETLRYLVRRAMVYR